MTGDDDWRFEAHPEPVLYRGKVRSSSDTVIHVSLGTETKDLAEGVEITRQVTACGRKLRGLCVIFAHEETLAEHVADLAILYYRLCHGCKARHDMAAIYQRQRQRLQEKRAELQAEREEKELEKLRQYQHDCIWAAHLAGLLSSSGLDAVADGGAVRIRFEDLVFVAEPERTE